MNDADFANHADYNNPFFVSDDLNVILKLQKCFKNTLQMV